MKFTNRSFHFAIISLVIMAIFITLSAINRNGSTQLDALIGFLITLYFVTVIIGLLTSLLSIKESRTTRWYIAFVVNIGLALWLGYYTWQNLSSIATAFS